MWTTLASSIFGSITGIVSHWMKAKEEENKREHELRVQEMTMKQSQLNHEHAIAEIEASIKVTEVQTEGQLLIEESKGFNEAVAAINTNAVPTSILEKLLGGGVVQRFFGTIIAIQLAQVDVIRGLVRPSLTVAAFTAIGYLAYTWAPVVLNLEGASQMSVVMMIIDAVVYVSTAATQFWFLDRHGAREIREKHSK